MRQEYSVKALQKILDQYEDLGVIELSKLFTSGLENSNHYCKTSTGEYVVKIYEGEGMSKNIINFEVEAMHVCYEVGAKTPRVYRNTAGSLTTELIGKQDKLAIVMDIIDGENADKQKISDVIAQRAGEETAKIATALSAFSNVSLTRQNYEFDGKTFLQLESKVKHLPDEFDRSIFEDIFERFRKIQPIINALPTGLIHNDIASHNLLVRDNKLVGVIDFSDMAFSPYVQDLSVAMSQMVFAHNWQPHQANFFIDGYRKYHDMSDKELEVLYDHTLSRYALLAIEIFYWNVRDGEDKQRTDWVNDTYGFLERFLEFGKDNFNKLIGI